MPAPDFPDGYPRDKLRRSWKFRPLGTRTIYPREVKKNGQVETHWDLNRALKAIGGRSLVQLYNVGNANRDTNHPVYNQWLDEVNAWWAYWKPILAKRYYKLIEERKANVDPVVRRLKNTVTRAEFEELKAEFKELRANIARDLRTLARAIDELKGDP